MTTITTTTTAIVNSIGSFTPTENKAGKISANSEKIAMVLNAVNVDGLTALARDGKGAIGSRARMAILGNAFGLPQLRVAASLDGGQWGNALSLLVGEYGPAYLNRATMKGKSGCVAYMAHVVATLRVKVDSCETVKAQDRAISALNAATSDYDVVCGLFNASEVARITAQEAAIVAPEVSGADVAKPAKPAKPAKRKKRTVTV